MRTGLKWVSLGDSVTCGITGIPDTDTGSSGDPDGGRPPRAATGDDPSDADLVARPPPAHPPGRSHPLPLVPRYWSRWRRAEPVGGNGSRRKRSFRV